MRIALVAAGGFDESGRERVTPALLWLVERLARRHEVIVYVMRYHDRPRTYRLLGATIHDLGSPRGTWRRHRALVSAMRRDGPFDVVHGYQALPAGLAAALAGKRLGVPAIATFDSGEFVALPGVGKGYGLQLRARHRFAVATAARLAKVVTVCSRYQQQLAQKRDVATIVIPIGVDAGRFEVAEPREGPPWYLLHVASLNPVKDQATLVRAVAELADRSIDVHLDVVGENTLGKAIPDLVRELDIAERVSFHGYQPTESLASFYARAHVFVLSSRHEAANVAVLEAAASGVPIVGTAVGHLADWTSSSGVNPRPVIDKAVTVPTRDPSALADAVERVLASPEVRSQMARAARAWTLAHDADWTAREFEALYERVSGRKAGQIR
jgi:glycosyltransferase involved in cell wall biosynthesis